jgi:hypothetical protein
MNIDPSPLVFTVINESYMQLGLAWGSRIRALAQIDPIFICTDESSFAFFSEENFPCYLRKSEVPLSCTEKLLYTKSSFPNDKASFTVQQKLHTALYYLRLGRTIIYSDVDAIWIQNPTVHLPLKECDISFQPGSFPLEAKNLWGFTVCTGFFHLRPSELTIQLMESALAHFDGSDQRSLNYALLENFQVKWSKRPKDWEHCRTEGGWTEMIEGLCQRTGLKLAALPHAYYQRHGILPESWRSSIICHPNTPKDMVQKVAFLRNLGL